jgi:hypothetical protein
LHDRVKDETNIFLYMCPTTGGVPREIFVIASMDSNSSDNEDDSSRGTVSRLPSEMPEVLEMKRKLDEMEKEKNKMEKEKNEMKQVAEKLIAQENKRARRGPKKNLERGDDFVPLKKIEEKRRLSAHRMYSICKLVRMQLFCNMKYYSEYYRDGCLRESFQALAMHNEDDQKKFRDYVLCYVERKTTSQRNNAIFALKKCMMGEDGGSKLCTCDVSFGECSHSNTLFQPVI